MDTANKTRLHPLLAAAAISLIVLSGVGIAALTGVLPHSRGSSEPLVSAEAQKPIEDTVTMPAPAAPAARPKPRHVARAVAPRPPAPAPIAASVPPPPPAQAPAPLPGDAGVIASVKEVDQPGQAKGLGAVAGGIAGAVVGHNISDHNKLVTVLGGVGGALLGNQVEKTARATKRWEITVRMDDGSTRTIPSESEPAWHAGDRVRVLDGQILKS